MGKVSKAIKDILKDGALRYAETHPTDFAYSFAFMTNLLRNHTLLNRKFEELCKKEYVRQTYHVFVRDSICCLGSTILLDAIAESDAKKLTEMIVNEAIGDQDGLEKTHRVSVAPECVEVICLGLDNPSIERVYPSVEHLPQWMQDRLAVLMMMSFNPPTEHVAGVGRRIDETVFWVIAP